MTVNKLKEWSKTNGLKFSPSKTKAIHFCKLRKHYPNPIIKLNENGFSG